MARRLRTLLTGVVAVAFASSSFVGASASADESAAKSRAEWFQQLEAWREELEKPWTKESAKAKFRAVEDPAAIAPLMVLYRKEKDRLKWLYIEALGSIAVALSTTEDEKARRDVLEHLVTISVEETPGLRNLAIKQLATLPYLRDAIPQYVRYLRSKWVSRAAEALSVTKLTLRKKYEKPDRKLFYALVDRLVVVRPKKIPVEYWYYYIRPSRVPGQFGVGEDWGYRHGVVEVDGKYPVPSVREALKEYSGHDYGYDRNAWRRWYAKEANASETSTDMK